MRFLNFFYVTIPALVVGTLIILTLPWLAVVALAAALLAVMVALGSFAWVAVAALSGLGHSILGHPRKEPVPIRAHEHHAGP